MCCQLENSRDFEGETYLKTTTAEGAIAAGNGNSKKEQSSDRNFRFGEGMRSGEENKETLKVWVLV